MMPAYGLDCPVTHICLSPHTSALLETFPCVHGVQTNK